MPTGQFTAADIQAPQQTGQYSTADVAPETASPISRAASSWWDQVNPIGQLRSIGSAVQALAEHPAQTLTKMGEANDAPRAAAVDAFKRGDYVEGVRHGVNWLLNAVPGVGSTMEKASDQAQSGDVAGGIGTTAGLATNLLAPAAVPRAAEAVASTAAKAAEALDVPKTLYQSALKPSQVNPANAARAVQSGLEAGIPISEAGQSKLASLIDDLNQKTKGVIASDPNAKIDTGAVAQRLQDTKQRFANQALPQSDLGVIERAHQEWLARNGARPAVPGTAPQPTGVLGPNGQPIMNAGNPATPAVGPQPISAVAAQDLKQGTYQQIRDKFGEMKTAQIESEKALARGLKEELETQFPELKALNSKNSDYYGLQPYLEKAVARIGNHNIASLGDMAAAGAGGATAGPVGAAGAALMRHVLGSPEFKSRLAISLNAAAKATGSSGSVASTMGRIAGYSQALDGALSSASQAMAMPAGALPMAASGNQQGQ